jgi:hypothetical protein
MVRCKLLANPLERLSQARFRTARRAGRQVVLREARPAFLFRRQPWFIEAKRPEGSAHGSLVSKSYNVRLSLIRPHRDSPALRLHFGSAGEAPPEALRSLQ